MKATELEAELARLVREHGDTEVVCQAHGCCNHGHDIIKIEYSPEDEPNTIVIRV